MPKLKALAEELNCTVSDNRSGTELIVTARDGWSFNGGALCSIIERYGSGGSYRPEWRQASIIDVIEQLEEFPPTEIPWEHLGEE